MSTYENASHLGSILHAVWARLWVPTSSCPDVSLEEVLRALVEQQKERENPLLSPLEREVVALLRVSGGGSLSMAQGYVAGELMVPDIQNGLDVDEYDADVTRVHAEVKAALERLREEGIVRHSDGFYEVVFEGVVE